MKQIKDRSKGDVIRTFPKFADLNAFVEGCYYDPSITGIQYQHFPYPLRRGHYTF
jgi:hypothetical protein